MATRTTLASACAAGDQTLNVTSATGFAVGSIIQVDNEFMVQTGAASGTVIPVRRAGYNASIQVAHAILAPVLVGTASELPNPRFGQVSNPHVANPVISSIGADGAITPPVTDTIVFIDKATAAALTLADPAAGCSDGVELTIFSNTAAAHTVTYTAGFNGTTSSSDVATFAATKGNSITLLSARGVWGVKCLAGVTIA